MEYWIKSTYRVGGWPDRGSSWHQWRWSWYRNERVLRSHDRWPQSSDRWCFHPRPPQNSKPFKRLVQCTLFYQGGHTKYRTKSPKYCNEVVFWADTINSPESDQHYQTSHYRLQPFRSGFSQCPYQSNKVGRLTQWTEEQTTRRGRRHLGCKKSGAWWLVVGRNVKEGSVSMYWSLLLSYDLTASGGGAVLARCGHVTYQVLPLFPTFTTISQRFPSQMYVHYLLPRQNA